MGVIAEQDQRLAKHLGNPSFGSTKMEWQDIAARMIGGQGGNPLGCGVDYWNGAAANPPGGQNT